MLLFQQLCCCWYWFLSPFQMYSFIMVISFPILQILFSFHSFFFCIFTFYLFLLNTVQLVYFYVKNDLSLVWCVCMMEKTGGSEGVFVELNRSIVQHSEMIYCRIFWTTTARVFHLVNYDVKMDQNYWDKQVWT